MCYILTMIHREVSLEEYNLDCMGKEYKTDKSYQYYTL